MVNHTLTPTPFLGGYDQSIGGIRIRERHDLGLISMAIPLGDDAKVKKALKAAYGVAEPSATKSTVKGDVRIIRSAVDQMLMLFPNDAPNPVPDVKSAMKDSVWVTDQSNTWVVLEVSGDTVRDALERLCPIDLHPDTFAKNASARTVMEHMGALIVRTGDNSFLLMSASSSAGSFLHAVETSAKYAS